MPLQWLRSFWGHSVHSDFRKICISKMAGRRAKQREIWASWVSIQCTEGTFDTSVIKFIRGGGGAFQFSTSLDLENGWSQSETDWNLGLRGEYSVYRGYFWHLSA